MSMESLIQAMPKVELNIQLEGTMQLETLLLIADENEIRENNKHFAEWIKLIEKPDFARLHETVQVTSQWLQHPENLTRIVYDLGVALSKQNVRYAEVSVTPSLYMQNGMSMDEVMAALNDGRDRVQRAWGVRLGWVLMVPRDEPRRADDILRWATGATGKKGGVVALGLIGRKDVQPVGQFERAFRTAEKKGLPRVCQAGDVTGAEGIIEVINALNPDRLVDGWGAADAPDVLNLLREKRIPVTVCLARALCLNWVQTYADYPLRRLYDEQVTVVIGSGMPSLFKSNLAAEYLAVVEHCGFSLAELEELALNAVRTSFLSAEEAEALHVEFSESYARLRAEQMT